MQRQKGQVVPGSVLSKAMSTASSLAQSRTNRSTGVVRVAADWAMYIFIALVALFQLVHYPHFADYLSDVIYPDLARSILEKGAYQIRLLPQTTLPPGLPIILALVGRLLGLSPAVTFGVIAVSTGLGLIASYELLRRVEGRAVAAIACLLLVSCPALFGFNTAVVFPEMPYLFMSMAALLLALKIDNTDRKAPLISWILLLAAVLVLAVLIRSVGVALLVGLISWIMQSFARSREIGRRRLARFAVPLAFGLAAQLGWSMWARRHQTLEWQLPGYPASYVSQLRVKDGQQPELGFAHLSDIPSRVERNVVTRAVGLSKILIRRRVSEFWSSPAIFGVEFSIAVGLISSLRAGGQLHDWYYLWYECIFWVWPWDYRDRFVFPVVPLACLYLWRGIKAIRLYLIRQPRRGGLALALIGSILCFCSAAFALRLFTFPVDPEHVRGDHLQTMAATGFWGLVAVSGLALFLMKQDSRQMFARAARLAVVPLWVVASLAVALVVGSGVKTIVAIGHNRLHPDITQESLYPEMEASTWIRENQPPGLVIMAREPEFVFHYAQHPTVWFPPISDPKVLMDGIQRHRIGLVVVAHHPQCYWLPSEEACFQVLQRAYPDAFHLIHRDPDDAVFQVVRSAGGS